MATTLTSDLSFTKRVLRRLMYESASDVNGVGEVKNPDKNKAGIPGCDDGYFLQRAFLYGD